VATEKVVIIGGGIAGLSAAQELAERHFEVHVFERRSRYGGKAASLTIGEHDSPYKSGPKGLPGEHGFRFFPGWYRHLPDTLKRIPYKDKTVYENLVAADVNVLASYDRDPIRALLRIPTSINELKTATQFPVDLFKLGITPDDVKFFFGKLWTFLTSSEERRRTVYDNQTWWDFLEADKQSPEFRAYLVDAATRNTVAARPKEASAYVIAKIAIQTLLDTLTPQTAFDRVLNGPTNEVWIDPWVDYLRGLGVWFHDGYELDAIQLEDRRIKSVTFTKTQELRRASKQLDFYKVLSDPEHSQAIDQFFADCLEIVSPLKGKAEDAGPSAELTRAQKVAIEAEEESRKAEEEARKAEEDAEEATEEAKEKAKKAAAAEQAAAFADIRALFDRVCRSVPFKNIDKQSLEKELSFSFLSNVEVGWGSWKRAQVNFKSRLSDLKRDDRLNKDQWLVLEQEIRNRRDQYQQMCGQIQIDKDVLAWAAELVAEAISSTAEPVKADYFVFALPVEQMAYYVNRSDTLQSYDKSLSNIILLSEHVDWMAGIQFYLSDVVNVTRGHIDLLDSEWALTAISEVQFWKDIDLKSRGIGANTGKVKSILSVDISAWGNRGRFLRKEAYNCTRAEIAAEVWNQLKTSLNRPQKAPLLKDTMLIGWQDKVNNEHSLPFESYYLDDNIVDLLDRKKQALYGKFLTVQFSAAELIRKQSRKGRETETSFMYGQRNEINVEPLMVNRVGALRLRPKARTGISNLFLAGDYVMTNTLLATMEGANESARAAVNELLAAAGSSEAQCDIWPLEEPLDVFRRIDQVLFRRGQQFQDTYADIPIRIAAGMADAATRAAANVIGKFLNAKK
jgi:uncharacterized protein with NAD-binding domain and iron-sulfur cluster